MLETLQLDYIAKLRFLLFGKLESFSLYGNSFGRITDESLVEKFVKGDKKCFEVIYDKYSQKLFRYLYFNFGLDKASAEDVLQEVFIKLRAKLDKFNTDQNFENWLYKFTHNLTIDRLRGNDKHQNKTVNFSEISKNSEDGGNNLLDNIVLKDERENLAHQNNISIKEDLIGKLIDRLDGNFRETIVLYYFEQKSYEEIAYILGKDKNYIGTMIFRAKDKIKEIIKSDPKLQDAIEFDL